MKETSNSVSREVASIKSRVGANVIKEDLQTLREDAEVVLEDAKVLGRDLKAEGKKQLSAAEIRAKEALEEAKERSKDQYAHIASYVRENPGQSVAIAFFGGIVASMLFGRR